MIGMHVRLRFSVDIRTVARPILNTDGSLLGTCISTSTASICVQMILPLKPNAD